MTRRMKIACVWIECRCSMVKIVSTTILLVIIVSFPLQCFNYFFSTKIHNFVGIFFKWVPQSTTSNYHAVEPTHKHQQGVKNENSSFDEALKLTHKIQHWLDLCNYRLWQSWNCFFLHQFACFLRAMNCTKSTK